MSTSPAGIPSSSVTSRQPAAERDATLACVCAALIAPGGAAGGWFAEALVPRDDVIQAGSLAVAVIIAVAPPLILATVAELLARRADVTAEIPLRRARVVRRLTTPFAFVGGIVGFFIAIGAVFAETFLRP